MSTSDRYEFGVGMFGGPGGTYGRYGIGPRVLAEGKKIRNLATQFDTVEQIEARQRRRFGRKKESGYTGEGYHFANYPNMVGALGAGTLLPTRQQQNVPLNKKKKTAAATDGMSTGGTAFSVGGNVN